MSNALRATGRSCGAAARRRRGHRPSSDRGLAVATGTAGLLVVPLDRLRQVDVGHEAHVGCRCPCRTRSSRPSRRRLRAGTVPDSPRARKRQPGVVGQGVDALGAQELGGLLDALAAQGVHDARGPRRLRADEREQLLARFDLRVDAVLDVRRSKFATKWCASGSCRRSVISRWVASVAVAVSATRGTPGNSRRGRRA